MYAAQSMIGQRFSCGNHGQLRHASTPQSNNVIVNKEEPEVRVFPNPNNGTFMVDVTTSGHYTFALYGSDGRNVKEVSIYGGEQASINLTENFASGMYLWILFDNESIIQRGKLIVE